MDKLREFIQIYRLYRTAHRPIYAARLAWDITINRTPF